EGGRAISAASSPAGAQAESGPVENTRAYVDQVSASPPAAVSSSGHSAQLPEKVLIEMLDINLSEYRDYETARVRFYPNGTADEMHLVLIDEHGDRREIILEVTTGLATVESNPSRFR